ncbi:unnamed protein product [Rhodiola kirilowii]
MAVSSSCFVKPLLSSSPFQCRSDQDFSGFPKVENASQQPSSRRLFGAGVPVRAYGLSSLILRFPPNFVMQLSTKARRNCSNIGFAQIVAASWSDEGNKGVNDKAVVVAAASSAAAVDEDICSNGSVQVKEEEIGGKLKASFLSSDGSLAVHAGERLGRGIVTDAITTPVVNTSAYFFKKTAELIDFQGLY